MGSEDPDGGSETTAMPCSICFDSVTDGGDRSTARLTCGHQFHLDCIGSAFNSKGLMQCPNCRKIEKGNWLYSNGHRSYPEFSVDDWMREDDLVDMTYTEVPAFFCPFSRLARVPFPYEEGEYNLPMASHVHPPQPSSSSGSQVSTENVIDDPIFNHWNSVFGPIDLQNSHNFPAVDVHHQSWDHHPQSSNHNGAEQVPVPSASSRAPRTGSDAHHGLTYMHSFVIAQGSGSRTTNSVGSSMLPHYAGNSRGHSRHENHPSYQHHNTQAARGTAFPGARRFGNTRGMATVGPTPPSDHGTFYLFPPTAASGTGRNPQDADAAGGSHFYGWEREGLVPYPGMPVDRDFPWWGPSPQTAASSDSSSRAVFWPQHGSEGPSSQSHGPFHPRLHPFI